MTPVPVSGALVSLVCVILTAFPASVHAQQSTDAQRPALFLVRGEALPVLEGTIRVPAVRGSAIATGDSLTLAFVRFPHTAASPGAPIVFLAGGPGDAATRALQGMPRVLLDSLRRIADVIAFDQRGTGRSEPRAVLCPPGGMLPLAEAADPAGRIDILHGRLQRCLADPAHAGIPLSGLTTVESTHDLEALRHSLGASRLSLLAGSYGTHLALAYAREYPTAVHRMVLVGVEGPDHTIKLPSRVEKVLVHVAAVRRPSLLAELDTLLRRLRAAPASHTAPTGQLIVLGDWDLQRYVSESMGTMRTLEAMMTSVPVMLAGNYSPLAQWAARDRAPRPLNLMNLAMDCASYATTARLAQIRAEAPTTRLGDAINFPLPMLCDRAGLSPLPPSWRAPMTSDVAALLIAGEFDVRTPVDNAREVAASMPNAVVLLVRNASHDLFGSAEVSAALVAFLKGPPSNRR